MSPLTRAIRGILWLSAAGIMVVAFLLGMAAFLQGRKHGVFPLSILLWGALFIVGAVLFFKSTAIARSLNDDEEDEDAQLDATNFQDEGKE
jgi:hypothetical protein